jgi:MoaA/NifB/PqqE/SkfB family radical SAM enzyme
MTITPHNQHQIVKALMMAHLIGADFTVRPINFSEAYYRNRKTKGKWDTAALRTDLDAVAKHIIRQKGPIRAAPVISYLNRVPEYITTGREKRECSAGTSSFFMDPTGEVYPCLFVGDSLGNIRSESIDKIWASPTCIEMRKRIAKRRCPGCLIECEAMRDIRRDRGGLIVAALKGLRLSLSS